MMMTSLSAASMRLAQHLRSTGTTRAAFALAVGSSEAAVHHWVAGYARPRPRMRGLIQTITGIEAGAWEEGSEAVDLELFIAGCEERERRRREQHEVRMAAWRARLDQWR